MVETILPSGTEQRSTRTGLRVLMISLDPGLVDKGSSTGNTLERHQAYASRVASLDIMVLGGRNASTMTYDSLTIHSVGVSGLAGLFRGMKLARRIAHEKQANIIVTQDPHATGWIGMRLKYELHIPLLVDVHGDFFNNLAWLRESWKHRLYAMLQKRVLHAADHIRVVSFGIEVKLRAAGIPKEQITVIETPINSDVFLSFDEHQKIFLEEIKFKYQHTNVLVFSGRLVLAKNLEFLIRIVAALKKKREDFLLLIIGDGELRSRLEQLVTKERVSSHVQFLGAVPHAELAAYYRIARCLILPSTNESFGKVIIEAGLSGTTTLASNTTGAQNIIIDGRTGFLAPINDLDAFVGMLEELLDYPEQTKQLGDWAKEEYSKKYSGDETIDRIITLWQTTAHV